MYVRLSMFFYSMKFVNSPILRIVQLRTLCKASLGIVYLSLRFQYLIKILNNKVHFYKVLNARLLN